MFPTEIRECAEDAMVKRMDRSKKLRKQEEMKRSQAGKGLLLITHSLLKYIIYSLMKCAYFRYNRILGTSHMIICLVLLF